jgi:hypothetical protein
VVLSAAVISKSINGLGLFPLRWYGVTTCFQVVIRRFWRETGRFKRAQDCPLYDDCSLQLTPFISKGHLFRLHRSSRQRVSIKDAFRVSLAVLKSDEWPVTLQRGQAIRAVSYQLQMVLKSKAGCPTYILLYTLHQKRDRATCRLEASLVDT